MKNANTSKIILFKVPPPDFDMSTASSSALKSYGIPQKPLHNEKHIATWNRLAGKKLTFIIPEFTSNIKK